MENCKRKKEIIEQLAARMEQMYYILEREKSNRHVDHVEKSMEKYLEPIQSVTDAVDHMGNGTIKEELLQALKNEQSSFFSLKSNMNTKFKLYVRGLGNSGKSTLVNALLAVSEKVGSERDKKPMTFTIESFSDEISILEAQVTIKGENGFNETHNMSRAKAKELAKKERVLHERSKQECQSLIKEACKGIVNLKEREEKRSAIYRNHHVKTKIREIKWGIGRNKILDNCILVDTPGLRQELRYSNVLEDVHHYEADGILWVISSEKVNNSTVVEEYKKELEYFKNIRDNNRMIAVINMYDEEITYGSTAWNRLMEQAKKNLAGQFDHIIGVNNLMAYEGNVEKSSNKIETSNIEELRMLINMLFTEKSSEDCIKNRIDKVNRFLYGYQKCIEQTMNIFDQYSKKYDEKTEYIRHGSNGIQSMCENQLQSVVDQYMQEVKNRVYQNASKIKELDEMSSVERDRFLNQVIIKSNELANNLTQSSQYLTKRMKQDFDLLYKNSVVSEYEFIAFEEFSKKHRSISSLNEIHAIQIKNAYQSIESLKLQIENSLSGSFMGNIFSDATVSAVAGFITKVRKLFENKEKKIIQMILNQAKEAANQYQKFLNKNVKSYEEACLEVRDLSLEQELGRYESIGKTKEKIEEMKNQLNDMGLVGITLSELIIQ